MSICTFITLKCEQNITGIFKGRGCKFLLSFLVVIMWFLKIILDIQPLRIKLIKRKILTLFADELNPNNISIIKLNSVSTCVEALCVAIN